MRIAVFGHKNIGTRESGVEVAVSELYERIGKTHEVTVYDRWVLPDKRKDEPNSKAPYEIKKAPTFKDGIVNTIFASFFATLFCLFGGYDVVHVHSEEACFFLPLLKWKNVVVTVHGLDWQNAMWGQFAKWYVKRCEQMIAKHADEIIVLSQGAQEYFRETYDRDTVVIPNGVSIKENNEIDKIQEHGIEPNDYILYTGRISPEKRLDLLVNAYVASWRKEKLVIAGRLPDKLDNTLEFAKTQPNIILTGMVSGDLLDQLYTHANLFVLPSDLEGQSISLLEALAHGLPCLASDIPENVVAAGKYGHFFKAGNLQSLTEALKQEDVLWVPDPDAQQKYVLENHDWDDVATITVGLYQSVMQKKEKENDSEDDEDENEDQEKEKSSPLDAVKNIIKKKK